MKLSEVPSFTEEELGLLNRKDLLVVARTLFTVNRVRQDHIEELEERIQRHESYIHELEEKVIEIDGKLVRIRSQLFAPSSEKSPSSNKEKKPKDPKPRTSPSKLPSERYPHAEIIDKHITYEEEPECKCCGHSMQDSGMVETSEYLTRVPAKYIIVRQHRHKYRCGKCHGDLVTTPSIPRVTPGSSYSDELVVDATLSKYCDLIPMERYCQMAKRQGFAGLPPHSLIGASFKLAEFLKPVYERLKQETLKTSVLLADETPHKMLEGDKKKAWYLWGFLSQGSCFYECHDTRSGDVAAAVLHQSDCQVLLTDVYSGYGKAVREANKLRQADGRQCIQAAYCNSHARRQFLPAKGQLAPPEHQFMIDQYKEVYKLEASSQGQSEPEILAVRQEMRFYFETMKTHAERAVQGFSDKSSLASAFHYFLRNFEGLVLFLTKYLVPIDNNPSERLLRSPVVGRKTWYGTHSREGAEASSIHFSLIEACKLNNLNPREYYTELIRRLHSKEPVLTPKEWHIIRSATASSS